MIVRSLALLILFFFQPIVCAAEERRDRSADALNVSAANPLDETNRLSSIASDPEDVFDENAPLRRFKKQAIQRVSIRGGWMSATDGDDLSNGFLETSVGFGIPLGSFDNILGVSPSFRVDWLDADPRLDVPSELYSTGVQFFWRKPIDDRWSFMAIVSPSVRSDFTTSRKALRVFGMALLTYQYIPEELSLSFGVVSLGRADLPVLPALGATWTPQPELRIDARFPESRIAFRIAKNGAESETWAYLAGGLGGNTWAVTRRSGRADELSLRDWRLKIGVERIVDGGGGCFLELAYAFARRLEYERTDTEISLSDGIMLRAGWNY